MRILIVDPSDHIRIDLSERIEVYVAGEARRLRLRVFGKLHIQILILVVIVEYAVYDRLFDKSRCK